MSINKLAQLAKDRGFGIKSYHSDNSVFPANVFKDDYKKLEQTIDFSGVRIQHQNDVSERNIKTVASWAQVPICSILFIIGHNML